MAQHDNTIEIPTSEATLGRARMFEILGDPAMRANPKMFWVWCYLRNIQAAKDWGWISGNLQDLAQEMGMTGQTLSSHLAGLRGEHDILGADGIRDRRQYIEWKRADRFERNQGKRYMFRCRTMTEMEAEPIAIIRQNFDSVEKMKSQNFDSVEKKFEPLEISTESKSQNFDSVEKNFDSVEIPINKEYILTQPNSLSLSQRETFLNDGNFVGLWEWYKGRSAFPTDSDVIRRDVHDIHVWDSVLADWKAEGYKFISTNVIDAYKQKIAAIQGAKNGNNNHANGSNGRFTRANGSAAKLAERNALQLARIATVSNATVDSDLEW